MGPERVNLWRLLGGLLLMKRKIFLSYKRKVDQHPGEDSEALADALKQCLSGDYEVFIDKGIQPGDDWQAQIDEHLFGCHGAIALLAPAALSSPHVQRELALLSFFAKTLNPPLCLLIAMIGEAPLAALDGPVFRARGGAGKSRSRCPVLAGSGVLANSTCRTTTVRGYLRLGGASLRSPDWPCPFPRGDY